MLRRVRIERFRGFELLEASLQPATVVVGPNSSGKTTLLYAIRFALQALADTLHEGTSRLHPKRGAEGWIEVIGDTLLLDHTRYLSVADWESLFYSQRTAVNQSFVIGLTFDEQDPIQEVEVTVSCGNNAQLKLNVNIRAPSLAARVAPLPKKTGVVNREIVSFVEQHAPRAVLIPSFYGVVRDEEYRSGIMVDRLLGAGDQSHIVRNLIARLSADEFTRLNAFLQDTLRAEIIERTLSQDADSVYPLRVRFRDGDGPLELSAAGAGLINLIALYAALERPRGQRSVIFLLDEPEAHLHPRLQGDMADRVTSLIVQQFESQVVMATHAVEIVNRLSDRDDVVVLRVDRGSQQVTPLYGQSQIVSEIGQWADLTPFSLVNFLASRQILFHEGKSDREILDICARLRYRTAPTRHARFARWTFASLEGSGNEPIVGLLQRLIATQVIPNLTDGDPVRLIVVLDRDYEREPGIETLESAKRVHTTRQVWSAHSIESLFLRPEILVDWLHARWGSQTPTALPQWIDASILAADQDADLNHAAEGLLLAKITARGIVDKNGVSLRGEKLIVEAHAEAVRLVGSEPARWQRGHDRSRFVLNFIRDKLPPALRGQFPANLAKLLETTKIDDFGDRERPIPTEIRALLDRMTEPGQG